MREVVLVILAFILGILLNYHVMKNSCPYDCDECHQKEHPTNFRYRP